jgi:hypothetical protein
MNDLDVEFQIQMDIYLESLKVEIIKLFTDAIQEIVYDFYQPTEYIREDRANNFLNSVKIEILPNGNMFVGVDLDEDSGYTSTVDGSPQYANISNYIEEGHKDKTGISGEYHDYAPRLYLERAYELIQVEFPQLVMVIVK